MNIFDLGLTSVASITVICYLAALAVKQTPLSNKWVPTICGALGGLMGYFAPRLMSGYPAQDPFTAVAVGIVSGLAATGAHQLAKQLGGKSTD